MKRIFTILCSLFFVVVSVAQMPVPKKPNPPRLVNDYTNTLTPEQRDALENKLVTYNDSTSTQIAVIIIASTKDYPIEDIAREILRQWGVGGAEHNNGIVLLVAKDDRKVRIETGYGLEGAIPDITAKSIIDNYITPNFKEGNYYRGLDDATDAIIKAAAGEYKAPAGSGKKTKGISIGRIIFILIVLFIIFGSRGGRGKGGRGMMSRRGYGDLATPWILGSLLGGGGGGGWSGGGGGGGGFGGFGGGGGGGGGASGSW
ncbi:MAG: TPM domain-containing protein [Bacteroidota bacterium]|nr:TPM domain-containing protein [Bacteroidota bacterium]